MKTFLLIGLMALLIAPAVVSADDGEEARLIGLIQTAASSPGEKEQACQRLKQIGAAKSMPALATLLDDQHLYQAACDALETMPFKEAGEALHAALKTSSGNAKAGVIHALGERRHLPAVSDLARLLKDSDPLLATSAARALGEIGGSKAVRALRDAQKLTVVRDAAMDALLRCATQLTAEGDRAGARSIFEELNRPLDKEHVRAAAYAGLVRTSGDRALKLVVSGIEGSDPAKQIVALQLAREIRDPKATAAFTNMLPKASSTLQAALLGLLQQRGDPAAAPSVASLARSGDDYVRISAIAALGTLGDASAVSLLASAAASADESEQKAARQALLALRRGDIGASLLEQLSGSPPEVQAELARTLAGRAEKSAVPRLMELTRSEAETTRRAAFRALNQLADASHFAQLTGLMEQARSADERAQVGEVFESIVQRAEAKRVFDVSPIIRGLETAKPETRSALLQVSALFADGRLRSAFRAALKTADSNVRRAAERAMCSSRDVELMPDLLALARGAAEPNLRALALEGYVRLVAGEGSEFPPQKRAELLKPAVELATRTEEKKVILSALAGVSHQDALELVARAGGDDVRAEAEIATLKIAKALLASAPAVAEKSLAQLAATAQSGDVRTNATAALKQLRKPPANQ
jgi:HEAT repeat protein